MNKCQKQTYKMKLKVPHFKLFKISPFKIFDISIVICFRAHATIEYLLESLNFLMFSICNHMRPSTIKD